MERGQNIAANAADIFCSHTWLACVMGLSNKRVSSLVSAIGAKIVPLRYMSAAAVYSYFNVNYCFRAFYWILKIFIQYHFPFFVSRLRQLTFWLLIYVFFAIACATVMLTSGYFPAVFSLMRTLAKVSNINNRKPGMANVTWVRSKNSLKKKYSCGWKYTSWQNELKYQFKSINQKYIN